MLIFKQTIDDQSFALPKFVKAFHISEFTHGALGLVFFFLDFDVLLMWGMR